MRIVDGHAIHDQSRPHRARNVLTGHDLFELFCRRIVTRHTDAAQVETLLFPDLTLEEIEAHLAAAKLVVAQVVADEHLDYVIDHDPKALANICKALGIDPKPPLKSKVRDALKMRHLELQRRGVA